ncbi:ankyrin repeat domain-containing protein 50 [Phytophthora cinnamomi]|uniref:ankyrin repeat domain-containing protein 50 n=1 Tax=Phytophthora cinnamomi TaxID=4785 RepID=UPI00355A5CC4|nr:ankyrin repeat domain-containing protein 50 [Phytophthora cinnamomi]
MESRFGLGRATMFSTINQLPFQLLLLILRWSHFHPEIVRVCAKKLRRQTQLIPQARVRQELAELQARESKVWSGLYPPVDQEEVNSVAYSSLLFPTQSQLQSPKLDRLSKCHLWDTQKQFYKDQGIRAWSSGAIPFGVSSSSFLAAGYARVAVDFLLNNASHVRPSFKENGSPNCFVWEAASGSCKFLHSFMLHFTGLVEADDEFKRRGLVPLVVATDLSEQVLSSRRQMTCFRPFIERGQLDFAFFDTQEFIHGCSSGSKKRKTLELIHAGRQWNVGSDGPVSLIGNYFFDSLRADVFSVAIQRDDLVRDGSSPSGPNSGEHVVVQVALLDKDTSSIANMDICLQPVEDPSTRAIYEDGRLNATLVQVLNKFRSRVNGSSSEPVSSTGLVLFPVEAFEFLLTLVDRDDEAELFPFAILAGDASFSFRDAISSAFITTKIAQDGSIEHVSLELPQLSPHPDCFCLPVDFEIFKLFIEHLSNSGAAAFARSELVSAPASDTFDVFFAMIEPRSRRTANAQANATPTVTASLLQSSFKHQFSRFTPGDCDLLWGMMSFDDGARCFSTDTLLALLAQTGWDFDLFAVLKWGLLNRLRQQENNSETEHYQQLLIEAGVKSWRTFYHMEQQSETDTTMRGVRLQLARWFYDLEAFDCVLEVLMPWRDEAHKDFGSDDVGVFYLLGLTSLRMEECWTALSFFRLCARLAPTKLKYQRQVARTLLALQTLRSASNSSNESDGVRSS